MNTTEEAIRFLCKVWKKCGFSVDVDLFRNARKNDEDVSESMWIVIHDAISYASANMDDQGSHLFHSMTGKSLQNHRKQLCAAYIHAAAGTVVNAQSSSRELLLAFASILDSVDLVTEYKRRTVDEKLNINLDQYEQVQSVCYGDRAVDDIDLSCCDDLEAVEHGLERIVGDAIVRLDDSDNTIKQSLPKMQDTIEQCLSKVQLSSGSSIELDRERISKTKHLSHILKGWRNENGTWNSKPTGLELRALLHIETWMFLETVLELQHEFLMLDMAFERFYTWCLKVVDECEVAEAISHDEGEAHDVRDHTEANMIQTQGSHNLEILDLLLEHGPTGNLDFVQEDMTTSSTRYLDAMKAHWETLKTYRNLTDPERLREIAQKLEAALPGIDKEDCYEKARALPNPGHNLDETSNSLNRSGDEGITDRLDMKRFVSLVRENCERSSQAKDESRSSLTKVLENFWEDCNQSDENIEML